MNACLFHRSRRTRIRNTIWVILLVFVGLGGLEQSPANGQTITFPSTAETLSSGESAELIQFKQPFLYGVEYGPGGAELAVTFRFVTPLLLDTKTWTQQRKLPSLYQISFSPDGKMLATAEGSGGLRLWDRDTESVSTTYFGRGQSDVVRQCDFSPSGKWLASAHDDRTVRVWDVQSQQSIAELEGHTDAVLSVAFSNDGESLYSGSADATIRVWNTKTWAIEKVVNGPKGNAVIDIEVSSDGSSLASVHTKIGVMIWNTKRWVASMHSSFSSIASAKDRDLFALGGRSILLTDGTRASERRLKVGDPQKPSLISALSFSPDGKQLAAGNQLGDLRIIEID